MAKASKSVTSAPDPAPVAEPTTGPKTDANDDAATVDPTHPPAPLDPEEEIRDKLAAIGDPYAKRREVNASLIALRAEMHEVRRSYEDQLRVLEDQHRKLDDEARWTAETKRILEAELATITRERERLERSRSGDEEAAKVRAQVESELKRAGIVS